MNKGGWIAEQSKAMLQKEIYIKDPSRVRIPAMEKFFGQNVLRDQTEHEFEARKRQK